MKHRWLMRPIDSNLPRRRLLALGATALAVTACGQAPAPAPKADASGLMWNLISSWERDFPIWWDATAMLADRITRMSNGRLKVTTYPAGEVAGAFEVFDAVAEGTAQMGHSCAGFWRGKHAAMPFFGAIPFGLNAQEMSAWLLHGGGIELWRELYEGFALYPIPAGNSGMQAGAWSRRPIRNLRDLQRLKMRIVGLGAEVLARAGGKPSTLNGSEIKSAMEDGRIDAFEWMGPAHDLELGAHQMARYYHFPSWQEPSTQLELIINQDAWQQLPEDLRTVVDCAARSVNEDTLALATVQNMNALAVIGTGNGVEIRRLPADAINALQHASDQVLAELGQSNELTSRIYESYTDFRSQAQQWHRVSEADYYLARD